MKNKLTIETMPNGRYRLFGYIEVNDGRGVFKPKKIRCRSKNLIELEQYKLELETAYAAHQAKLKNSAQVHQTWLTGDQLRDAEAAYRNLPKGRTLLECVKTADLVLGSGAPVECEFALTQWELNMERRKLEPKTIKENVNRAKRFLARVGAKMLQGISSANIEDYILRPDVAPLTQVGDARVLSTWFNFCVKEKMLRSSPLQLDLVELKERARPQTEPDILTPEQAGRLLKACAETGSPELTLFVILSTWCFLRKSEVLRLKPSDFVVRNGGVTVHLRGKKIGSKWRDIPVPAALAPLAILCLEKGASRPDVLENGVLKQVGGILLSEWGWKHARVRAGLLTLKPNVNNPHRPMIEESEWAPNILRHTGMSYLFQETGGDIELVTKRAGNSENVAYTYYLRRAEEDAYKKFNAVTAILGERKPEEDENGIAQESAQNVA